MLQVKLLSQLVISVLLFGCLTLKAEIKKGGQCLLTKELKLVISKNGTRLTTEIPANTKIDIIDIHYNKVMIEHNMARTYVDLFNLEQACTRKTQFCKLQFPIEFFKNDNDDGKTWRIKAGAKLQILSQDAEWSQVQLGAHQGVVDSSKLKRICQLITDKKISKKLQSHRSRKIFKGLENLERDKKILLLKFLIDENIEEDGSQLFEQRLEEVLPYYLPFFEAHSNLTSADFDRHISLKHYLKAALKEGKKSDLKFMIAGEVQKNDSNAFNQKPPFALTLYLLDIKRHKIIKSLRFNISLHSEDKWQVKVSQKLDELLSDQLETEK